VQTIDFLQVRAVIYPDPTFAVTASRDGRVIVWKQTSPSPPTFDATEQSTGAQFKTCLSYFPPIKEYPEGLVISSGQDALIEERQPASISSDNADGFMVGHANAVCSLDVNADAGYIVSGSWDHTAKVWGVGRWEPEVELRGHDHNVWAVLGYDRDTIITGCADQKIRIFDVRGKLRQAIDNKGIVRALAKLPHDHPSGGDFVAANNDGIITIYTLEGVVVAQLFGHESFIYSLAVLPTGEIVSSGEDRSVRVWRGTDCTQVITIPALSVWSVSVCPNGDIIAGSSDKMARIFTRDPKRLADAETIAQFDEMVRGSSIPQQQLGEINKTDMPGVDFLERKSGTKEGQQQMIKEDDGSVALYAWSMGGQKWEKIGEVVGSAGGSGLKQTYNGKQYDYVFDIDIEDGKPALKLPYNVTQNPYEAATKFLTDNELPADYLEEVANFIIKNTQGAQLGGQAEAPPGLDPMGTESRYRPGDVSTYQPTRAAQKKLPVKYCIAIIAGKPDAALRQIVKLNAQYESKDMVLNPTELDSLSSLVDRLKSYDFSKPASLSLTTLLDSVTAALLKAGTQWEPPSNRLAGLDLFRLLAASVTSFPIDPVEAVLNSGAFAAGNSKLAMMAIRFFLNLVYGSPAGRTLFANHLDAIVEAVKSATPLATSDASLAMAVTTFYVNLAVFITSPEQAPADNLDHGLTILEQLRELLSSFPKVEHKPGSNELQQTTEPAFRGIMALGTVIVGMKNQDLVDAAKHIFDVPGLLSLLKDRGFLQEPRFGDIIREIQDALR
jgi:phospholipase A-2-activating protein